MTIRTNANECEVGDFILVADASDNHKWKFSADQVIKAPKKSNWKHFKACLLEDERAGWKRIA